MCNLTDEFFENQSNDGEYREYLNRRQDELIQAWEDFLTIEDEAIDIQAKQFFHDLEIFETTQEEKEYRSILEWEIINNLK